MRYGFQILVTMQCSGPEEAAQMRSKLEAMLKQPYVLMAATAQGLPIDGVYPGPYQPVTESPVPTAAPQARRR